MTLPGFLLDKWRPRTDKHTPFVTRGARCAVLLPSLNVVLSPLRWLTYPVTFTLRESRMTKRLAVALVLTLGALFGSAQQAQASYKSTCLEQLNAAAYYSYYAYSETYS